MKNASQDPVDSHPASLWRYIGAVCYDSMLLFACLFFAVLFLFLILHFSGIISLEQIAKSEFSPVVTTYVLLVSFAYFAWQWHRGGQTLGMKTWRIKLESSLGSKLLFWQLFVRFCAIMLSLFLLGLAVKWVWFQPQPVLASMTWLLLASGFATAFADSQGRIWHDYVSATRLVYVPPQPKK